MWNILSPPLPGTPPPQQTPLTFHMEIHQDKGCVLMSVFKRLLNKMQVSQSHDYSGTNLNSPAPLISAAIAAGVLLLSGILQWAGVDTFLLSLTGAAQGIVFTPRYKIDSRSNFKSNQRWIDSSGCF